MMKLPDIETLQLCSLMNTTAFGIVFLLLWRGRLKDNHLLYWSLSALLYGGVMVGFGIWGEGGIVSSTLLLMLLAFSNVLSVIGLRHFQKRSVLEPWMVVPPLAIGAAHLIPIVLLKEGWLTAGSLVPRISDIVGLIIAMTISGSMMIAGPLRGQRIAGAAMLAYVSAFMLALVAEIGVLSGTQSLGVIPLLADQALLAVLNLGLLVMPADRAQAVLTAAALRDPLTGAWNRSGLELEKRRLMAPGATVIAIDVDHFKAVNDLHGHEAGDEILRDIALKAAQLADAEAGALARIGGDEFIMLLPAGCDGQRRIVEALMSRPADISPLSPTSLSIGLARVEDSEDLFDAAFRRADVALYQAKAAGRDRWIGLAA